MRGRPQTPFDVAKATGRTIVNPERYRERETAAGYLARMPGIGDAPWNMEEDVRAIWREISAGLPWLRGHHREIFAIYCHLVARMRAGELSVVVIDKIRQYSNLLGTNPSVDHKFVIAMLEENGGEDGGDAGLFN